MTTTVTVKTHNWPVRVKTLSNYHREDPSRVTKTNSYTEEFLAAHSEKSYSVTDTTSVTVEELPEEATSLNHASQIAMGIAGEDQSDPA